MKYIFILLTIVGLGAAARGPQPTVYSLDAATLSANKDRIARKDPAVWPAYQQLLKEADEALKKGPYSVMEKKNNPPSGDRHDYMSLAPYFWPDPSKPDGLPYIRKDGQTNPEVADYKDKEYLPRLCELVYTLSTAYYFSGREAYADHAAKLVRVWFLDPATRMNPNLNYAQAIKGQNDGRGAGLIDTRHFVKLIDGIGLLQGSKGWSAADQSSMKSWCAAFLNWMQTSRNGISEMKAENNHGTWYDAQRMALALYIDSTDLARRIAHNVEIRLNSQMDDEGKFPREMERTIALHYNLFDLEAFFTVASMADKLGLDLWHYTGPKGQSLQKGFSFLHPYLTGSRQWAGQQIKDFDFEEGYYILARAGSLYGCTDCSAAIDRIAGDKKQSLRLRLLY